MKDRATSRLDADAPPHFGDHVLWLVPFAGLVAWQVWMTLGLFAARAEPATLLDDRPPMSGRHPLHLYHGYLGAATLVQRGSLSCFDPNFYAGYPKTPVFDSGSRPAELALALNGGHWRPGAYKLAVAVICAAVPLLLWLGGRGLGLSRAAALLASALGVLVWWGRPCREDLEAGDVDLLFAALLAVAQSGLLVRFHRTSGPCGYVGLVVAGMLGWFAHPLFMAILLPSFLLYYLSAGTRHRLAWHIALFGGLVGAVVANLFWLLDWVRYWWIRVPLGLDVPLLAHRTFRTIWEAPLWGGVGDRAIGCVLVAAAVAGLVLWNRGRQRATARLFAFTLVGLLALAVAGIAAEPIGRLGAARLIVPGMLFAVLPAAHAFATLIRRAPRVAAVSGIAACAVVPFLVVTAAASGSSWREHFRAPPPLEIGLNADREAIVRCLGEHTTAEARILWEDRRGDRMTSRWTALLPVLTGRSFVGGLDPDAGIEHAATGLVDQCLCGKPVRDWTDYELRDYCERYNVCWVVCWTDGSAERFRSWRPDAEFVCALEDGGPGCLFRINRLPKFARSGSASLVRADARHIVLEDVRPENGEVLLSLHHQAGLRVAPSRVVIERATDPSDPIPFVRLLVKEPVACVTIVWDRR
jgi:hypothetical protein